jgi:hypothetical protein
MDMSADANPILPVLGVSRNLALSTEASLHQKQRNGYVTLNRNPRMVETEYSGKYGPAPL